MLVTISTILGALAAAIAILKDAPLVVTTRGPAIVRILSLIHDFIVKRKALTMLALLVAASICLGTYFVTSDSAHASPGVQAAAGGVLSTDGESQPSAPDAISDRPLVVCVPPLTLDTADTPNRDSTRYGREAARRISNLLAERRVEGMKIINDTDLAHALDRIERDQTGLYDEKTQIRVGKLLNASRMVIGEISLASVRSNQATISGQAVNTRIAEVVINVAVLDPETLERTGVCELEGKKTFLVSAGNQPPSDDTLLMQAVAAAINKLSTDAPFLQAATAPLAAADANNTPVSGGN